MAQIVFDNNFVEDLKEKFKILLSKKNFKNVSNNAQFKDILGQFLYAFEVTNSYGIKCNFDDNILNGFKTKFTELNETSKSGQIFEKEMLQYLTYFQAVIVSSLKNYANEYRKTYFQKNPLYVGDKNAERFVEKNMKEVRTAEYGLMSSFLMNYNALNEDKDGAPYIQVITTKDKDSKKVIDKTLSIEKENVEDDKNWTLKPEDSRAWRVDPKSPKRIQERILYSVRDLILYSGSLANAQFKDPQFDAATKSQLENLIRENRNVFENIFTIVNKNLKNDILVTKTYMPQVPKSVMNNLINKRKRAYKDFGIPSFIDLIQGWGKYTKSPSFENNAEKIKYDDDGVIVKMRKAEFNGPKELQDYVASSAFQKYVEHMATPTEDTKSGLPVETVYVSRKKYKELKKSQQANKDFPDCVDIQLKTRENTRGTQRLVSGIMAGVILFNVAAPSIKLMVDSLTDLLKDNGNEKPIGGKDPVNPGRDDPKKVNPAEGSEREDDNEPETSNPGHTSVDDHNPIDEDNESLPSENDGEKRPDQSEGEYVPPFSDDTSSENSHEQPGNDAEGNEVLDTQSQESSNPGHTPIDPHDPTKNDNHSLPSENNGKKIPYIPSVVDSSEEDYQGPIGD